MLKKAAIYARVSSQKQKEGDTIDSQIDALHIFAKDKNYFVPEHWIFLDDGVSGGTLQRPALDELRDMIRTESLDAILIYAPDRLARSYPHQLILLDEFKRHGVKAFFLKGKNDDNDSPESVMFNHFQGIFAEYERALILDRSRRGRIFKAKQGNPSALPSVAYGYKRTKTNRTTSIEIIESNASTVKEIYRLYIHEKESLSEIARILTKMEIKSPKGNTKWDKATIRDILQNRAYTGTAYFGKTQRCSGIPDKIRHYRSGKYIQPKYARKKLPEEGWLPIAVPTIISEVDFEMAQEQIEKNKKLAARNTQRPALLQGLVICGNCGSPCYKRFRKYKETYTGYYFCRNRSGKGTVSCASGWIRQHELDLLVYGEVLKLLQNPSVIRQELARRAKEASDVDEILRQEQNVKKDLVKLANEKDRLLDAYQTGMLDLKELGKRNQSLDARKNALDKEFRIAQAAKLEREKGSGLEAMFNSLLERIKLSSNEISMKDKQNLVRLLVDQVVVNDDKIKIVHCISPRMIQQDLGQLSRDGGS